MRQIIYRKSDLAKTGVVQDNTNVEWEIEHNVIPNFGGIESDYARIETNLKRFHLENINGEVVAVEDGLTIEEQRQSIISQLSALDLIVPRILEDIISQSNYNIHQSKLDIIAQKVVLRYQLAELD